MDLGTDIYNKTLPSGNNNRRVKMALSKTVVTRGRRTKDISGDRYGKYVVQEYGRLLSQVWVR